MDNKKYYWAAVGLIASIIFFFMTFYLQIRNGYARDEQIYVSEFIANGLWILLIGSVICCCLLSLSVFKIKNEKLSLIVASLTTVILIVFGLNKREISR